MDTKDHKVEILTGKNKGNSMSLTDREKDIVLAAIKVFKVNFVLGHVPDYELTTNPFKELDTEDMREIRNLAQAAV